MTTAKGGQPRLIWYPEMTDTLIAMRREGVPLYRCAEKIGVAYGSAVYKARELGVAKRMNHGPIPGWKQEIKR